MGDGREGEGRDGREGRGTHVNIYHITDFSSSDYTAWLNSLNNKDTRLLLFCSSKSTICVPSV